MNPMNNYLILLLVRAPSDKILQRYETDVKVYLSPRKKLR